MVNQDDGLSSSGSSQSLEGLESLAPAYLIDASIYIFRAYFALPPNWESTDGYSTEAVYGYTRFLIDFLSETQPDCIAAAFDESLETCFRNEIYPDYKCSRALPDENLAFQLQACREMTEILGVSTFASERFEADDLIGALAKKLRKTQRPMSIVTRDKDLAQLLIGDGDHIWDFADNKRYFSEDIKQKFGVKPSQIADYLALIGDSSDDIPGVPGIGPKTAAALLQHFPNVECLLEGCDEIDQLPIRGAKSLKEKITDYCDQIPLAKKLATIYCDAPLSQEKNSFKISKLKPKKINQGTFEYFCDEMGLGNRLKQYASEKLFDCKAH